MVQRTFIVFALVLLIGQCFGATPVATVSSTQAVTVSGITVPTNRVTLWPLSINDEIATAAAPAMVRFTDGTVVTLQRNSRMRLVPGTQGVEVKMLAGSAIYDLKPHTNVAIGGLVAVPSDSRAVRKGSTPAGVPLRRTSGNEAAAVTMAQSGSPASSRSGIVLAEPDLKNAVFSMGGKLKTVVTPNVDTITLDNGTILEVQLVSGRTGPGGSDIFIITKIDFPVPDGRGGVNYITIPRGSTSPLIGASLDIPGNIGTGNRSNVPIHITLQNGQTLTPPQLAQLLQQAANAAFNDTANNLPVPPGTQPPQFPKPVNNGDFSGHAT